jgi:multiple sugar transport system permease protein
MIRSKRERPIALAVLIVMAAGTVFPIGWLVLTGFKPASSIVSPTPELFFAPVFDNYAKILSGGLNSPIVVAIVNSIVVAVISTFFAMVLSAMAAYGLARLRPRGHRFLSILVLGFKVLPPIAMIVPLFLISSRLQIVDTQIALILPYLALSIPFATWLLFGFFQDLPSELEEAALIDGSTWFGAFIRVILPLAAPGLAATAVFSFSLAWNDLALALALTRDSAFTLPVLASQVRTEEGIQWGQLGATATIMIIPMLIFTVFASKHLVSGLSSGAVK